MAYSVNTTPLLQECESESEEDLNRERNEVEFAQHKPLFTLEPKDKYHLTYLIFYLMGVVTLVPWNFFITADDYWMYKFREVNITTHHSLQRKTPMQASFTSYISVCSAVPCLIFSILNSALMQRISLNVRFLGCLTGMFILFIVTIAFVAIDTDKWQETFFHITLLTVVLLNVFSAILSGSLFGVMGKFSPHYITAAIGGQALGGIFAALAEIVSLAIGASSIHSAYVYFTIGALSVLVAIISYVTMCNSVFFKHHVYGDIGEFQVESARGHTVSYRLVLRKMWVYGVSIMICFLFTVAVFPGIAVLIESEGKGHGNKWNDVFFIPTVCYLLFSVGDYFGRLIAGKLLRPKNGMVLLILSIGRWIFIPLLMMCNAHPRTNWDVVFNHDYQYIIITLACALSNGYLANITAIMGSKVVDHHEKELASTLIMVFMGVGLAFGSLLSLIFVKLL